VSDTSKYVFLVFRLVKMLQCDWLIDHSGAMWLGRLFEEFGRSAHKKILFKYVSHLLSDYFNLVPKYNVCSIPSD